MRDVVMRAVLMLLLLLASAPAAAQFDTATRAAIKASRAARGCELPAEFERVWAKADLDGDGEAETVVSYTLESCGGSNGWAVYLGVVRQRHGRTALVAARAVSAGIDAVSVADGKIIVRAVDYAPRDPRCCPTRKVTRQFALRQRRLVELK